MQAFDATRAYQEIDRLNEQVRGLGRTVDDLRSLIQLQGNQINTALQIASQTTGVTNILNNTDFGYSELGYFGYAWDATNTTLSQWYRQQNTSFVQIVENDNAAVSTSGHQVTTTSTPVYWDKDVGLIILTGDDAIYAPFPKNYALPGIALFIRFSARSRAGSGTTTPLTFRASVWENTPTPKIGETIVFPSPTLTLSPAAAAGGFTRDYIIVSIDSSKRQISSATTSISIDVSAVAVDNSKYVNLSWTRQKDAVQYLIYRSEDAGANWFQVAALQGGVTTFSDRGGTENKVTAPTASVKGTVTATSQPVTLLETGFKDVAIRLRVPAFYSYLSTAKQFLRIDVVDSSGAPVDLGALEIDIDRVLLATSLGKWTPSAADGNAQSNIITTIPDPIDDNPFPWKDDPYGIGGDYYY